MDNTRRAFGLLLAAGTVLLSGCGGGTGNGTSATTAAGPVAPPATIEAVALPGYVHGYTLTRVGWYAYDAGHTTAPLIANVQTSLNERGAVAGYYTIEACADCAYSEATKGTPTYSAADDYCIGRDGRMPCPSQDTAMNAAGTTAGSELMGYPAYDPYSAVPSYHAYAGATDLGTLGGSSSYATGINAAGQAVGYSDLPGNKDAQAFVSSQGIMTVLAVPGSVQSRASAINGRGQIAGYATPTGSAVTHGFFYSNGTFVDLGEGEANALNASGQVAGSNNAGAFLSAADGGALQSLGAGSAIGVNAAGQVVINGAGPFVWDGTAQVDLNAIVAPADPLAGQITLTEVIAINDSGQILVKGHDRTGWQLQFLMSPPPISDQIVFLLRTVGQAGSASNLPALLRQAQDDNAAGDQSGTCRALAAVESAIATDTGLELPAVAARRLAVEVHVMMSMDACTY